MTRHYRVFEQLSPQQDDAGVWYARLSPVGELVTSSENPVAAAREVTGIQFPIVEELN